MSLTALLARCLLALALVANGLPAMAMSADLGSAAASTAEAPCHDEGASSPASDAATSSPATPDCCDGGDCTCSCLHHAPPVPAFAVVRPPALPDETVALAPDGIQPGPQRSPSLRPPIRG
jgi:hypothetical protein